MTDKCVAIHRVDGIPVAALISRDYGWRIMDMRNYFHMTEDGVFGVPGWNFHLVNPGNSTIIWKARRAKELGLPVEEPTPQPPEGTWMTFSEYAKRLKAVLRTAKWNEEYGCDGGFVFDIENCGLDVVDNGESVYLQANLLDAETNLPLFEEGFYQIVKFWLSPHGSEGGYSDEEAEKFGFQNEQAARETAELHEIWKSARENNSILEKMELAKFFGISFP